MQTIPLMRRSPNRQIVARLLSKQSGADAQHAFAVAALLWALYLLSAPRSVVLEDDGLFILSAWFLGIEHPPGYPLYVLLGKLATLLPVGSPAWRVHALSGLLGALACAVLFLIARRLMPGRAPAYLAALGLGVSGTFWSQAIIADVYSLHALLLFLLLLLSVAVHQRARAGQGLGALPAVAALCVGLGLANHWPLLLLSAPGVALLWLPALPRLWRRLPWLLLWLGVGLLPYVWMVWRSQMQPDISFQGPIDSWGEFLDYVLRRNYAKVDDNPNAGLQDKALFLAFLVREAAAQLLLPGLALALIGFAGQWRRWGGLVSGALTLAFLGPTLLLTLLLGFEYAPLWQEVFRVYPTPAWGVLALWAGLGLQVLSQRFAPRRRSAVEYAGAALLLVLVTAVHWRDNDRSRDWLAEAQAATILDSMPDGATLLLHSDVFIGPVGYLRLVQGRRPDVTLISERALILAPKPFDPGKASLDEQNDALNAFVAAIRGPLYRVLTYDNGYGTIGWLTTRLDGPLADTRSYALSTPERALLLRLTAHGPFRDGWNEYFRRFLLREFAFFRALAELAGQWPGDDPALAAAVVEAETLPEAILVRAGVLSEHLPERTAEVDSLLRRFASMAGDPWLDDRELARYFNLVARSAQFAGDEPLARKALMRSMEYWPAAENPARAALGLAAPGAADARRSPE
jgi:hypothetical protein